MLTMLSLKERPWQLITNSRGLSRQACAQIQSMHGKTIRYFTTDRYANHAGPSNASGLIWYHLNNRSGSVKDEHCEKVAQVLLANDKTPILLTCNTMLRPSRSLDSRFDEIRNAIMKQRGGPDNSEDEKQ